MNSNGVCEAAGAGTHLINGGRVGKQPSDVLLVTAQADSPAHLLLAQHNERIVLAPGESRLICLAYGSIAVLTGTVSYRGFCHDTFARLLAFLDKARGITGSKETAPGGVWLPISSDVFNDKRGAEYWLVEQVMHELSPFTPFLHLLRHTEAYWLTRYLLDNANGKMNLAEMGNKYGLSYSHFRRVCKQVLGNSAKTVLQQWRVARALLERVENQTSLTHLAIKYGYASSSHFSTEIKKILGVSPRALSDITLLKVKIADCHTS